LVNDFFFVDIYIKHKEIKMGHIKLKSILAENMRRFRIKNLNEDSDQNNNGYPDDTEGSANKQMILFSGTNKFMDRVAINVFNRYGFDKTSIKRSYDPNEGIVEFKVTISDEIADKISDELERADRDRGEYGGYIVVEQ